MPDEVHLLGSGIRQVRVDRRVERDLIRVHVALWRTPEGEIGRVIVEGAEGTPTVPVRRERWACSSSCHRLHDACTKRIGRFVLSQSSVTRTVPPASVPLFSWALLAELLDKHP